MYFLLTDETNQQASKTSKFFIYGGVFLPIDKVPDLHSLVHRVRHDYGFKPTDQFKFDSHSRPSSVTIDEFKAAKNELLRGCMDLSCRFVSCLVLHDIARKKTLETLVSWGANTVIQAFHRFLENEMETGICAVDRLPFDRGFQFLQEKFQIGLSFPDGQCQKINRIKLFAQSCQGSSHAASAVDVILGAFRYCVNESEGSEAVHVMLPLVTRMMWHRLEGNVKYLRGYGLLFRPKEVQSEKYQKEYDDLAERLQKVLKTKSGRQ